MSEGSGPPGDAQWMRRALALGRRGLGLTAPNPPVGCVLVAEGEVIGEGWHRRDGGAHAEAEALADCLARGQSARLRGATAFVTLEPCSTAGRTGACVDRLIEAGVSRVVWAVDDPNPVHQGRARRVLVEAGIAVEAGLLAEEGRALLSGYLKVLEFGRPEIILKSAVSLDGRVVRLPGEGSWLSGPQARYRVQQLRATVDAIVIGGETLRVDDPALTLRVPHRFGEKLQPWRVVVTRGGELPASAQLFCDDWRERTLVARVGVDAETMGQVPAGVQVLNCVDLKELFSRLNREFGVARVLVESGGNLAGALMENELVDEWQVVQCGWAVGAGQAALEVSWAASRRFELQTTEVVGEDVWSRWRPSTRRLRPAVFFDRDGVVNDNSRNYYILRWEDFVFCDGILEALAEARSRGYWLVLVTSQKGVGKGLMTESDLAEIHGRMQAELAARGLAFDHIESFTGTEDTDARAKPQPGMVFAAAAALGIDLERSWVVGDSARDIGMGRAAGCRTVGVGALAGSLAEVQVSSVTELAARLREVLPMA